MDERYVVANVANGMLAIWDQLEGDFQDGPFECENEAKRLAFILNSRARAHNTASHREHTFRSIGA